MKACNLAKVIFLFLFLCLFPLFAEREALPDIGSGTGKLITKETADAILDEKDNIKASGYTKFYLWRYVDSLAEAGHIEDCEPYLRFGLQHDPWNMKYQLMLAEILKKHGLHEEAAGKARIIIKYGDQLQREKASSMLGGQVGSASGQILPLVGSSSWRVSIIPVSPVDDWLLEGLTKNLQNYLGVPVEIYPASFPVYPPDWEPVKIKMISIAGMCDDNPALRAKIVTHDFEETGWVFDRAVINSYIAWNREKEGEKGEIDAKKWIEAAINRPQQYNVMSLLNKLNSFLPPGPRTRTAYIGLGKIDLGSDNANFHFGITSIPDCLGIAGYFRFTNEFNGEPPDREKVIDRTFKQCLSNIGFILGFERCTEPTCARSYANNPRDQDKKAAKLCPKCETDFSLELGRATEIPKTLGISSVAKSGDTDASQTGIAVSGVQSAVSSSGSTPMNGILIRNLLRKERFSDLEALYEIFLKDTERESEGQTKLGVFFEFLIECRESFPGYSLYFDRADLILSKWLVSHPKSHLANALKGGLLIRRAWEARGSGWASSVTTDGWKKFREDLTESRKYLEQAYLLDSRDPWVPANLITVAMGLSSESEEVERQFARGVKANPDDFEVYIPRLEYLKPKWHGSSKEMFEFAKSCLNASSSAPTPYVMVLAHEEMASFYKKADYFKDPAVWNEIKTACEKLVSSFPRSKFFHNRFARFAYLAGDFVSARHELEILGERGADLKVWKSFPECLNARIEVWKKTVPALEAVSWPASFTWDEKIFQMPPGY